MQSTEKRIAALEAQKAPAENYTIIRRFVSPGQPDTEIYRLSDDDGKLWDRQPGETEQALIDRATLEVKRTPWGVACLTANDKGVSHADN
jgi:predicted RNA polymerase sigma factor